MKKAETGPAGKGDVPIERRELLRWIGCMSTAWGAGFVPLRLEAAPGGGGGPMPLATLPPMAQLGTVAVHGHRQVVERLPSPRRPRLRRRPHVATRRARLAARGQPHRGRDGRRACGPAGIWKGRFRGAGRLDVAASIGAIGNVKVKGETTTFDWTVDPANPAKQPRLILTFTGPVRDLRVVRPGASIDNPPLLHADALDYYKQFHTLRFLGFMGQNETEDDGEATWAARQPAAKWHGRKSWEAMVEFFKVVHQAKGSKTRGIWWNVPYRFGLRTTFKYSLAALPGYAAAWASLKADYGIGRLDAYEWQLHLDRQANQDVKRATTFSPGAGVLVQNMAQAMKAAGFNLMCFYMASPVKAHAPDIHSYLWPLNESFAPPRTSKGQAIIGLIAQTGQ